MQHKNAPLFSIPGFEAPEGAEPGWCLTEDAVRLRVVRWLPPNSESGKGRGTVRGTIVLMHGRTEFIEKYFEVVGELIARDFAVVTFDWRGQGLSDRPLPDRRLGHVSDFAEFDRDLAAIIERVVAGICPKPWIALGHSMGGHVALRALERHAANFAATVSTAPMVGIKAPMNNRLLNLFATTALTFLGPGRYVVGSSPQGAEAESFEDNPVTSDPERHERQRQLLLTYPELIIGGLSYDWLRAATASISDLRAPGYPEAVEAPVLLAGAGADQIVDPAAAERFAQRLPRGEFLDVAGARHEILMERDPLRDIFWNAFDAFVDRL